MKIINHNSPFQWIEIIDAFDKNEVEDIINEFETYRKQNCFKTPSETNSATYTDANGTTILKQNSGIFLEDLVEDGRLTNIEDSVSWKYHEKIYDVIKNSPLWYFNKSPFNRTNELISYYESGDNYKPHFDSAQITTLSWFCKEPKKFIGGDLIFNQDDIKVPFENNKVVIFPSFMFHQVEPVSMENGYEGKGFGRYVFTQFLENVLYVP